MNFQNLPDRFKKYILADPGMVFFELDKDQSEWVITAYACGDPRMIEAVENKRDIHTHTAHLMFNIPEDIIKKEADIIGITSDPDWILQERRDKIPAILEYGTMPCRAPRTMSCRQAGKKSNHGLNYKEGYKMYALKNEVQESEGRARGRRFTAEGRGEKKGFRVQDSGFGKRAVGYLWMAGSEFGWLGLSEAKARSSRRRSNLGAENRRGFRGRGSSLSRTPNPNCLRAYFRSAESRSSASQSVCSFLQKANRTRFLPSAGSW